MGLFNFLYLIIILCYLSGSVLFFTGAFRRASGLKRISIWPTGAGFVLHTLLLIHFLASQPFDSLTQGYYVKLLSWCLLLVLFVLWLKFKYEFLALTGSPLALLLFISSLTLPGVRGMMPESLSPLFFGLHIGSIFLSIGLLTMAFGAGLLFLHLNRKIKTKEKLSGFRKDLPSLAAFDKVNHWAAILGFPLFTLGLLSGFFWAKLTWGRVITWDPKEVISLGIWLLYGFLFHQRLAMAWKGRKPALLAIWIFLLTIISMAGVNLFLPTHHSFIGYQ